MPSNSYPLIAREGWLILFVLASLFFGAYAYIDVLTALIFLALFLTFLFLFRDPPKVIPSLPLGIVSPVHGKIESIEISENTWLERKSKRIRIKMAFWDIFSLRSPIEGKIMNQWSKSSEETSGAREYAYWIQTDEKDDVVTALHFSKLKWFYRIYLQSGHRIGQGQRCGYLFFGSRVDVFVEENSRLDVKPGDAVESGSSVLCHIVHDEPVSAVEDKPNNHSD